jgi:UDP-GlcNAc3NAcA epimerase
MNGKSKIVVVVGARPQFIKHAALEIELSKYFDVVTIHTGQHYDENMSQIFFSQLGMAKPSYMLNVGSAGHGIQTGKMMIEIEEILLKETPQYLLVYGDTNSTLAGALVAAKLNIKVIHIEAGLRSYNRTMPEETNRVLCDHISDLLFCPTQAAVVNLAKEGINKNVFIVGDIMIDMITIASKNGILKINEDNKKYYFGTIHRPYNTDIKERLLYILNTFQTLDKKVKFTVHPRTMNNLSKWVDDLSNYDNITFLPPLSYFDSLNMQFNSTAVITDSGGMQKEAYFFRKKCITIRSETEWVETVKSGWNTLLFDDLSTMKKVLNKKSPKSYTDLYGTGDSAKQIANTIFNYNN